MPINIEMASKVSVLKFLCGHRQPHGLLTPFKIRID